MDVRQKRQQRIAPHWENLVADNELITTKATLLQLMQDLRDEGNALFKDADFDTSWLCYRNALQVAKDLEMRYYEDVDKEFVSTLFSNRAFCSLKRQMYEEAAGDCDVAIRTNSDNIKAYYRKVLALKGLKKNREALQSAEEGMRKLPAAFKELVQELRGIVSRETTLDASSAVNGNVNVHEIKKTGADSEWLQGTNIHVTEAKPAKNKMPKKTKKAKNRSSQQVNGGEEGWSATTQAQDSGADSDGDLNEDETFATNYLSAQENARQVNKVKLSNGTKAAQQPNSPAKNRPQATKAMGLDDFGFPRDNGFSPANSPVHKRSVSKEAPKPTVTLTAQQQQNLKFPLYKEYDYVLACKKCFVKIGEGIKGYRYVPNQPHPCPRDLLLVQSYPVPNPGWIKVRPRPDISHLHITRFQLCQQFEAARTCRVGEERCSFAHNQAELKLWTMDKDHFYNIETFINTARALNINNTKVWERALGESRSVEKQTIPGLTYKVKTKANQQRSNPAFQTTPMQASVGNEQGLLRPEQHLPSGYFQQQSYPNTSYRPPATVVQQAPTKSPLLPGPKPPQASQFTSHPSTTYSQPSYSKTSDVPHLTNPIEHLYSHKIVCSHCFQYTGSPGTYVYKPHLPGSKCEENVLAMVSKMDPNHWVRVRERTNHRDFPGNYKICNSVTFGQPQLCKFKEEGCSFAHNDAEKILWRMEKEGRFSVTEFIMQRRDLNTYKGYTTSEILRKHPGKFCFICRACFFENHRVSQQQKTHCSGPKPHDWNHYKTLAHIGPNEVTAINERAFVHKTAFFKICKYLQFCVSGITGDCRFAHSILERDVWMLERDTDISRDKIVHESELLQSGQQRPPSQSSGFGSRATTPSDHGSGTQTHQGSPEAEPQRSAEKNCPFVIHELCELCWKKGTKSYQDGDKDQCKSARPHQLWSKNCIYMLMPSLKQIRPLPRRIPKDLKFVICSHIRQTGKCDYSLGGPCQFAHSQDEIEVWKWMVSKGVSSLSELYTHSQATQKAKTKVNISGGQSVVSATRASVPARTHIAMPTDLAFSAFYCRYCGVQCNSQKQWDAHCSSDKHTFNVNSDKEHQWNFRQPPWGIPGNSYQLCHRHMTSNSCEYSSRPDMYNLCRYAHSHEELDEWLERYQWRQMKREMARQECVYSYMDQLLEKYETAESGSSVIVEHLDGVNVNITGSETLYKDEKDSTHTWTFNITTAFELEKVALLYNKDRLHFALSGPGLDRTCQVVSGEVFAVPTHQGVYSVDVVFSAGMFGSFSQWVIFDFGIQVVLVRKLSVEVGTRVSHEKVKKLREALKFDRWTGENREIVRMKRYTPPLHDYLLRQYKAPDSSDSVITQHSVVQPLNSHNYSHKMAKMLELEEITRHQIISSYNLYTTIELRNMIQEEAMLCARPGELFARVPLNDELNEDTDAGKLILTSVRHVLFAPQNQSQRTVYEADIVTESDVGMGRDYVYVNLTAACCEALKLKAGMSLNVEIQFQLNRLAFCEMHYAIDQLSTNNDIVFPDISKMNPKWSEEHVLKISSKVLNDNQLLAVRHIAAERQGYCPPIVMYGPFGTGKTETLAQAAMVLLKERQETRILICTETNSAADLYITRHLGPFMKKMKMEKKLLRVFYTERRMNTVEKSILEHCFLSPDKRHFVIPSREEILQYRIVVITLAMSLELVYNQMKGIFTHIFVDEAAQALECEVIRPLSLATASTCVVLSGDHIQLSPKVYSPVAQEQNFGMSLLERLYTYYEAHSNHIDQANPLNVLLSINYRSKMEILRFIASVFYGGPETLISMSNIPSVVEITPLTFYAVQGCEVQDQDSTSYYNAAEIQEVVARVAQLLTEWPEQWGQKSPKDICVLSPYADQVRNIRDALKRSPEVPELKDVSVFRVMNVPGKEFRAVYLSTVRTRHLLETDRKHADDFGFLSDPKLLNTALTRAQSLVAVVGDPVALCAIGECMTIWRTFLKHCQNMKSIYPKSITVNSIKQLVVNLLNSAQGKNLEQFAEQNLAANQTSDPILKEAKPDDGEIYYEPEDVPGNQSPPPAPTKDTRAPLTPIKRTANSSAKATHQPYSGQEAKPVVQSGLKKDCKIDPKLALRQLAVLRLKCDKLAELTKTAISEGRTPPSELSVQVNEAVNPDLIYVREERGSAVLSYKDGRNFKRKETNGIDDPSKVVSGRMSTQYSNLTDQQLQGLLRARPDVMKHCLLHCDNDRIYAQVISPLSSVQEIEISCRERCGKAFHMDEVIVEILQTEGQLQTSNIQQVSTGLKGQPIQGQVVSIMARNVDPENRLFVCTVDYPHAGLMIPINQGIPNIYNLSVRDSSDNDADVEVTVYEVTEGKIRINTVVKLDPHTALENLFVVKFLDWDANISYPLGIVIHVLPAGSTVDLGMRVLDIEHNISRKYSEETERLIQKQFPTNRPLPSGVFMNRKDYRDRVAFTVSPTAYEHLDNALSIEQLQDDTYLVGVHISDVAYFVKQGSPIDQEAAERGVSYYPLEKEAVHMIPPALSTNLCSFIPGKDRPTISVFLKVSSDGSIVSVKVERCVIKTEQFDFSQVEAMIQDPEAHTDHLKSCVLVLCQLAQLWRSQRLGNAHLYSQLAPEARLSPEARLMIEELMIMTNQQVANMLLQSFPDCTPLWCQEPPHPVALEQWKKAHAAEAVNAVALTSAFLQDYATCHCRMACKCVFGFVKRHRVEMADEVSVMTAVWDTMTRATELGDFRTVQNSIVNPENLPRQMVALLQLKKLQQTPKYVNSGTLNHGDTGNYALNVKAYVHFTKPLHRYMDLSVQRLVCSLIDSEQSPLTQIEVNELCKRSNDAATRLTSYQEDCTRLHLAAALKAKPLVVYPVVEEFSDTNLYLSVPSLPELPLHQRKVILSELNMCDPPEVSEQTSAVKLKWQERVYELPANDFKSGQTAGENSTELCSNRFTSKIPAYNWQRLLSAVRECDMNKLLSTFGEVKNSTKNPYDDGKFGRDVTSEPRKGGRIYNHFCDFTTEIDQSNVIKAQVGATVLKGILSPSLQLVSLTPRLDICLEHNKDPVTCFTSATARPLGKTFGNAEDYGNAWLPVIGAESAVESVNSQQSIFIHNVRIDWREEGRPDKSSSVHVGKMKLPLGFCRERRIQLVCEAVLRGGQVGANTDKEFDYLCVRYPGMVIPEDPALVETVAVVVNSGESVTWTCHCVVTSVSVDQTCDSVTVSMELVQKSSPFPSTLLQARSGTSLSTLEWIPKLQLYRDMEEAICEICDESPPQLAYGIALKDRKLLSSNIGIVSDAEPFSRLSVPGLPPPNTDQINALTSALTQRFSVINGMAGSGKTVTAIRMAYLFTRLNLTTPHSLNPVTVLLCSSTERSVDRIASHLLSLGEGCPRVVRVYSQTIENQEYPMPREVVSDRCRNVIYDLDSELSDISLHQLVRQVSNPTHQSLSEYDMLFMMYPNDISDSQVEEYRSVLEQAERAELAQAEVVLCTCQVSRRICKLVDVKQLIIDDAGTCSEPEAMIPIVASSASQVVLIGDPKQLQPPVRSAVACQLGMANSLLHRYSDQAITLSTHYRMHEGLAAFPAYHFYGDTTPACGSDLQVLPSPLNIWPNKGRTPVLMCHLEGAEEASSSISEGRGQRSYSNVLEARAAGIVGSLLVKQFSVAEGCVGVLCPYRAQCAQVQTVLKEKNQTGVTVSMIADSQGAQWDYVILTTVRSLPPAYIEQSPTEAWKLRHLGPMADPALLNLAITRAKKGIFILGNKDLLCCDPTWRALLTCYMRSGCVVDQDELVKRLSV